MNINLPEDFIDYTRRLIGEERWAKYLASFDEEPPVSIRINPFKPADVISTDTPIGKAGTEAVAWCRDAYYLRERPDFTLDPLLHAGAYYVQEASSMFLDEVLRQIEEYTSSCSTVLDLCAAPGGKSTLLRAALPKDALLFSNEPDRKRANILMENMQKQGNPNVIVTNNYAKDYRKAGLLFDLILTDVPCSGEGMFRKDNATIKEWSLQNVMKCQQLQRSIVEDIWQCLKPGGILIYSTCTFNAREDEENVKWIMEELGAEIIPIQTKAEWNINGSLLNGFDESVCRFIPGITNGEGIFMAVLRKTSGESLKEKKNLNALRILSDGNPKGTTKGKDVIPAHAEALLCNLSKDKYTRVELSLDDALKYLRHEAIILPEGTPKGFTIVTYKNLALGFVKNIGNRANNLYPQEWRIRKSI